MRRPGFRFNRGRLSVGVATPAPPPEPTGTLQAVAGSSSSNFAGSVGISGVLAAAAQASSSSFAGTVSSASDPQTIMGANCTRRWKSTNGITVVTGVSSWLDMVASQDFIQATTGNQPAYSATGGPNSKPTLTFDGSNDSLATTMTRAAPGTTTAIIWAVMRQLSWTSNDPLFNDSAGTFVVRQVGSSPQLVVFAGGTNRATNGGAALNTWVRLQADFLNSAADALKLLTTDVAAGTTSGNTAGTAPLLGRNGGSSVFGNYELCEVCFFDVVPSGANDTSLDSYVTSEYGSGLV